MEVKDKERIIRQYEKICASIFGGKIGKEKEAFVAKKIEMEKEYSFLKEQANQPKPEVDSERFWEVKNHTGHVLYCIISNWTIAPHPTSKVTLHKTTKNAKPGFCVWELRSWGNSSISFEQPRNMEASEAISSLGFAYNIDSYRALYKNICDIRGWNPRPQPSYANHVNSKKPKPSIYTDPERPWKKPQKEEPPSITPEQMGELIVNCGCLMFMVVVIIIMILICGTVALV